jgi:alkylation response protein AidB-like acyl-CoA dehydrogenase
MSDGLADFRAEVRRWLLENCPPSLRQPYGDEGEQVWGGRNPGFRHPDQALWLQRMADKGWTAPEWPTRYGGAGLSRDERRVLREEMSALSCRPPLHSFGIAMLAPALLRYGSEEQRLEHLPPMARGAIRWCQGYSEPGAGSDLASLRTAAVRDGATYRVSGAKIWTSHADLSDWIFCLVRTNAAGDKRDGISFLLIDMRSPGIDVRPIKLISGASPFCEVFFDDVVVPERNRVGKEGEGWDIAKYLLTHERSMISGLSGRTRDGDSLGALAMAAVGSERGRLSDAALRVEIANFEIDALSFRYAKARVGGAASQGIGAQSSALKYYGTELNKRRRELVMDIEGAAALSTPWDGEASAPKFSASARAWLRSKANSIEGGTTEIQLNIIARRILGLPQG